MNDTKVVTYRCVDFDCDGGGYMEPQDPPYDDSLYVTHADYRALEERNEFLVVRLDRMAEHNVKLGEELASLRARVGELVEADRDFDRCIVSQIINDKVYDRRQVAMRAFA